MFKLRSFIHLALSTSLILSVGLSAAQPQPVAAQSGGGIKRQLNAESGKVSFIGPESGLSVPATRALGTFIRPQDPAMALAKRFAPEFGLTNPERDLAVKTSKELEKGRLMVRYQQKHQGIPVLGGELIINTNANGDLYSINGEVSPGLTLSTEPTITSEEAKQAALQALAKWYQSSSFDFIATEPELWIYDESLLRASNRVAELVWRMEVTSKDKSLPVRELMLINAQRGNISLHFNQIDTAWHWSENGATTGISKTAPPGSSHSTAYRHQDTSRSINNAALALVGATWYVTTTGSDSNSCSTAGSSCKTINAALEKATAGDTVLVQEGLYTGMDGIAIFKSITLRGGWNSTFSTQTGVSAFDFLGATTTGLYTETDATIERLSLRNGYIGFWIGTSTSVTLSQSSVYGMSYYGVRNSGSLTLENSTVSGNLYTGIYNFGDSINIINSTITDNSSSGNPAAGGVFGNSPVLIQNSILADNTTDGNPSDCYGNVTSLGNNIIGTTTGCDITLQSSDLIGSNLQISSFLSSGYHALFSTSPAVNAGNASACPAVDQRGVARPAGIRCDIGAYEYATPGSAAKIIVQTGSYQVAGLNASLTVPIKALVLDNVGSPVSGSTVTFLAPSSGAGGVFSAGGTNQTTAVTDVNGIASASTFTTNSTAGSYNITASVGGASETAKFVITNLGYYVKPGGNDNSDCLSPATACLTINGAINKAQANAKIFVAGGTYTDSDEYGYEVVMVNAKSISLSGGWNTNFTSQNQQSIIDGLNSRNGISIYWYGGENVNINIDKFIIKNSGDGLRILGGTVTLSNSSLINNQNGVHNQGMLTVTNSTASQNSLYGIANHHTLNVQFSTITKNMRGIYSGSYSLASTTIQNSILANNATATGPNNCEIASGSITSTGYNIINSTSGCSMITQATDRLGTDPLVSPLLDGGFHALLGGSPAINTGNSANCPSSDQRGVARPIGTGCDIGAFEYRGSGATPAYIFSVAGSPQTIRLGALAPIALKISVLDSSGDPVSGRTVTFTAPATGASGTFANTNTNTSTATTNTNGSATASAYSANNTFGSYVVKATVSGLANSADFQLFNGAGISTYSANNSTSLPGALLCNETSFNCTNGSNLHADKAHHFAIETYKFYATKHGRNSIDNNGMTIVSSVHYDSNYSNAFWDGAQIVYGDGYGYPLADDVVAHEYTHGVTQYEATLFYYYQSGAINESFSDLWGEYFDQSNGQGNEDINVKWQIGEDVAGQGPSRSMSYPPGFFDPDKMSSTNYYQGEDDSGGVHTNSGVNNKAVYLMVDGGTFNGKTITALGWTKTAAIYYEAQIDLLTSGSDYSDLYYALQQACSNLIGQNGITAADCVEVKDAIDSVEMNLQPAPNFNPEAPLCDAGVSPTYTFTDDLEAGTSNWTFTNGGYTRWQVDSQEYGPFAQSGVHSLYADDYPAVITDASARLAAFTVPVNGYLHFAHAFDFEDYLPSGPYYFDGGVLEYSTNAGASWLDASSLIDSNGYRGVVFTGAGNPLSGRWAFVGTSHGYISTRLNLSGLVGKSVTFRWRMGLDEGTYLGGWWVDNIKVYSCIHPNHNLDLTVGSTLTGRYYVPAGSSVRQSLLGVDNGPVKIFSTNSTDILAAMRVIWKEPGFRSSYSEMMGLPKEQLSTEYWFPWYNNMDTSSMDQGFRIANVNATGTNTVQVWVGNSMLDTINLGIGASVRVSYSINNGPIRIVCTTCTGSEKILAALRVIWKEPGYRSSYSEMMGLPKEQLSTEYFFPWYNHAFPSSMDQGFRIANVNATEANSIEVWVNNELFDSFSLGVGLSTRVNYPIDNGPIRIVCTTCTNNEKILAALRVIWKEPGFRTSYMEMMGLPKEQLSIQYWFPWYNNVDTSAMEQGLRIAVLNPTETNTVKVMAGAVELDSIVLGTLATSTRVSYPVNTGPINIICTTCTGNEKLIVAMRVIWKEPGYRTSYSEMIGLPAEALSTEYWFPWYNNAVPTAMEQGFRIAVP